MLRGLYMSLREFKDRWFDRIMFSRELEPKTKEYILNRLIRLNKERLPAFIKTLTKLVLEHELTRDVYVSMLRDLLNLI